MTLTLVTWLDLCHARQVDEYEEGKEEEEEEEEEEKEEGMETKRMKPKEVAMMESQA